MIQVLFGPAYRNRTHIHGVEDRCIIHYTKAGCLWCEYPGSNRDAITARDFKSLESTNFSILANSGGTPVIRTQHQWIMSPLL